MKIGERVGGKSRVVWGRYGRDARDDGGKGGNGAGGYERCQRVGVLADSDIVCTKVTKRMIINK